MDWGSTVNEPTQASPSDTAIVVSEAVINGTDQENGTSFDQMAGAIWRSVTLEFFLLFLLKQLSQFVSFLFFLRFLPRFCFPEVSFSGFLVLLALGWRF